MARSMERVQVAAHPINALWEALVCPEGHKYEVLEVNVAVGGTANRQVVQGVWADPNFYLAQSVLGTPAFGSVMTVHNAVVVYPGEAYWVQVAGSGATPWDAMLTYIDVDY